MYDEKGKTDKNWNLILSSSSSLWVFLSVLKMSPCQEKKFSTDRQWCCIWKDQKTPLIAPIFHLKYWANFIFQSCHGDYFDFKVWDVFHCGSCRFCTFLLPATDQRGFIQSKPPNGNSLQFAFLFLFLFCDFIAKLPYRRHWNQAAWSQLVFGWTAEAVPSCQLGRKQNTGIRKTAQSIC